MLVDSSGRPLRAIASPAPERRADSWQNAATGIGTLADKTMHGRYTPVRRITDPELTNLYNGSSLAAKIVAKRPMEMFRRGYELTCDDVEASDCKDLQEYANETLHLDAEFLQAQIFANLYGGDLVVLGVDDGNFPDEPLDESRIRSFEYINAIDRRFTYVMDYYTEPGPKFGRPQHYLTSNAIAGFNAGFDKTARIQKRSPRELAARGYYTQVIHESRCIRFEGVSTDVITMQTLAGWTWSVLQRVYDAMRKFEHDFDSASYLLSDASQAVFTLKGLVDAISAGNLPEIQQRIAMLEHTRSVMNAVVLDGGDREGNGKETFERKPTPFGGIAELLNVMMLKLASEVDYPVTELFGRAASGLNAAAGADSETRKWYDGIGARQEIDLAPLLRRVYGLVALSQDCPVKLPKGKGGKPLSFKPEFRPLFTPTDEEQAKVDLAIAQRDQIYLAEGVISPEVCAAGLGSKYPALDVDAVEESIEAKETFDPHEGDPEPEPPAGQFGGQIPAPEAGVPMPSGPSTAASGSTAAPPAPPAQKAIAAAAKPKAPPAKKAAPAKPKPKGG